MSTPRRPRRGARAGAVALAVGALSLPALALPASAAGTTYRQANGPADCVSINPDGSLNTDPGSCSQFGPAGQGRSNQQARNVILIIGDGMGQQEITAARNYVEGAGGRFEGLDNLPHVGLYTHHSINKKDGSVNYVTDSAALGTAWATGTKTYNGAIGVDVAGRPEQNLIEVAKNAGMRTGNVTTSEIQDATPAVMGAHVSTRSCYAPSGDFKASCEADQRVNGGLGSISEQLVDTRADVALGGLAGPLVPRSRPRAPTRPPTAPPTSGRPAPPCWTTSRPRATR